jgi:hypothetical protein
LKFDLLFLPFLGGYVFYTRFSLTAYAAVRAIGQHLLLRSAFCGLLLLILARFLLVSAPYVGAHSDSWLLGAMSVVPGLGIVGGATLFLYARNEIGGGVSRMLQSPKGVLLPLGSAMLFGISVSTVRVAPSFIYWLPASAAMLLVVGAGAWVLCAYTHGRLLMATFRVSWFFLIIALAVAVSAGRVAEIDKYWHQFSPFDESGAPALALILGALLWYPLNLLIPYETALRRFHSLGHSDAMDRFLFESAERSALLLLSLSDGKFYVGQIKSLAPNPTAPSSFVRVLPSASGYRHKETKELIFTSFYEAVFDELIKEDGFKEEWLDQFIKVLPFSSIISANLFDSDIYIRFRKEGVQEIEPGPSSEFDIAAKVGSESTPDSDPKDPKQPTRN